MDESQQTLNRRPSLEEILGRYEKMQTEIREALSKQLDLEPWIDRNTTSEAGCGEPFETTEGESHSTTTWLTKTRIPDSHWKLAKSIVIDITTEYDFGKPTIVVDERGEHEIVTDDPYGGTFHFGTAKNTSLRTRSGCHLPRANHPDTEPTGTQASAPVPEWVPASLDPLSLTWVPRRPDSS